MDHGALKFPMRRDISLHFVLFSTIIISAKSLSSISTCADWRADFLHNEAKSRSNPDGLQGFLTKSGRKIRRQDRRGEMLNRL